MNVFSGKPAWIAIGLNGWEQFSIHSAQLDPDSDQKSCKEIPQAKARVA